MAQVVWTTPAVEQLQEIVAYVAQYSIDRAEKLNERLLTTADRLELFPQSGRVVPEFGLEHLRELIVRPYRILYTCQEENCAIVAVIHSSRDLTRLLKPEDFDDA